MISEPNSQDRMRSVLVLVATIATITFNGLAAVGYVNDVTPVMISDRYPTVLTPAGYAFSIWSLIYVGLTAFSIYQLLPQNVLRFRPVRSLYVISCVLNCAWIYFWHREQIGICLGLIFGLLSSLIFIILLFRRSVETGGSLFTKGVFGLYAGWVTAATLINLMICLKFAALDLSPAMWTTLGVTCLLLAAGLGAVVRVRLQNYLYPLAIAWAATAIAVKQSGNTAIVVTSSLCVIVCLVMAVSFVMDQKSTSS